MYTEAGGELSVMIVKATVNEIHVLKDFLHRESALNIVFLHELDRFGVDRDCQEAWLMRAEDGRIIGVVKRLFQNASVYAEESEAKDDTLEELGMFLCFLGAKTISGPLRVLMGLELVCDGYRLNPVILMHLPKSDRLIVPTEPPLPTYAMPDDAPRLARLIHSVPDFAALYRSADEIAMGIRSRISTGQTRHLMALVDDQPVCQANTTLETKDSAVIGGVVTLPEYRGRGVASAVVSQLCYDLCAEGKTPHLFFENEKAGALYRRIGFIESGRYGMLTRDD